MSRLALLILGLAMLAPLGCTKATGTGSSSQSTAQSGATPKATPPGPDIRTQP